ncbi:MAG TPA: PAS domain-containing protein [Nodosilinea sp.]|nr:PAS domain-containing protein [Nodosilinea sp.]
MRLSNPVTSLLGYTAEASGAPEDLSLGHLICPDDLDRVAEHFQSLSTLRHGEMITLEYRMRHADGTWRWLRSYESSLITARDGFPLQILGIVQLLPGPAAIEEDAIAAGESSLKPAAIQPFAVSFSTHGMADWRMD